MQDAANLNRLAYFVAVVDAGSFTKAAASLGITKAVVSQQVAKLEQEVGTTLLLRTTRRLQTTEAGGIFHARCVSILRAAEEALAELAQSRTAPKGTLRMTAPHDYGTSVIVPVVTAFTRLYPECQVELNLTDTTVDLLAGNLDLAIRVGWLDDSSLQARRIGRFRQLLVGSPEFADKIVALQQPVDCAGLPFVSNNALREPLEWTFTHRNGTVQAIRFETSIAINMTPAVMKAVMGGGGLAVLPDFLAASGLSTGKLIPVLTDWHLPQGGVYTVYPAARYRPPKVTAFVEMLVESLRK